MKKSKPLERSGSKKWVPVVDGGWGWVVVVGSFFVHVFADGIVYSFGVILEAIISELKESNAKSSVIISLLTGLTLGVGPIASALTNKFGCRVTTITGSLIATTGCAASYFARSVEYLMVSVGCVMGFGFGLMYCPAIVIVTMWFEKKRAMATGIAVCGAGIGTIVFAPFTEWVMSRSTWNTVFLYYAVFVLLCSACGAVFRPLKFVPVEEDHELLDVKESHPKANHLAGNNEVTKEELNALAGREIRAAQSHDAINGNALDKVEGMRRARSLVDNSRRRCRPVSESFESTGFITVKDVFYTGSVKAIPEYESKRKKYHSLTSLRAFKEDGILKNMETVRETEENEKERQRLRGIWRTIEKMTDLSLLADPIFILFAISNFLTSIAFNSPLVFLPSHAENLGCTKPQAARVLSMFGAFNTIGRIMFGLISDRKLPTKYGKDTARNRLWIYNISLSICGTATIFVFICQGYYSLSAYAGFFGLTLSSYVCLTSVLLVDLLGIERLTNAFGLLLLFQGVGTVVGPPISGLLADLQNPKSYEWSFVFCGVALLISGLMLFAIPKLRPKSTSRSQYQESDPSETPINQTS